MPKQLKLDGLFRARKVLKALSDPDVEPLLLHWRATIEEDNRDGLLAGTDGYGRPLKPLSPWTKKHRKSEKGQADPNAPPLIPCRERSRAIDHFETAHGRDGDRWFALGAWKDVLSKTGVPFLPFHFRGEGRLPVRDLAHVRPAGLAKAKQQLKEWTRALIARARGG